MFLADRLELGQPRRTKEGYLAVRAKAARAGIYDYLGREVDPEGKHFKADQVVKVYRPEDEVFATDSVRSFLLKPITDDHPAQPVTADNWKTHAKGVNAGAMRDGEYLAFDLVLMDAPTIDAVEKGKRELSNGYACEITIGDGVTPDGQAYQATQRQIRGNHVAVVKTGRAGSECRIGDSAVCADAPGELIRMIVDHLLADGRTYQHENDGANLPPSRRETSIPAGGGATTQDGGLKMPHVLMIDGLQVPNVSDEAKAAIEKLQGQVTALTADKTALETKVGELTATVETKDGEMKALQVKLDDALDPAKQAARDAARAQVIAGAQLLKPGITVDGKSDAAIRKEAVEHKLGDISKDMSDAAIDGAFAALSKDAKPAAKDPVRDVISSQTRTVGDSGASVRNLARAAQY